MPRPRFSISRLLVIVAVFAIALGALRAGSPIGTTASAVATLSLLLTAILGAIFLRGEDRAYWAGFALFGWTFLGLTTWPGTFAQVGLGTQDALRPVAEFFEQRHESEWYDNFYKVGDHVGVLLLACLGGTVARVLAARARSSPDP